MARSSTQTKGIFEDTRGSAYVEAVIMLPVLVVLFGAMVYVRKAYVERQARLVAARSCAWQYANDGCEGDPPDECRVAGETDMGDQGGTRQEDSGDDMEGVLSSPGSDPSALDRLTEFPVLGEVFQTVFGKAVAVESTGEVERPEVLGGQTQSIAGGYYVMCNDKNKDAGELVKELMCSMASGLCG
ncbi:MAG: TadE/TadG family type IV pilus assembly protein [Myxococcota bacterium]